MVLKIPAQDYWQIQTPLVQSLGMRDATQPRKETGPARNQAVMGGGAVRDMVEGQDTAEDLAETSGSGPEVQILDFRGENSKKKKKRDFFKKQKQQRLKEKEQMQNISA